MAKIVWVGNIHIYKVLLIIDLESLQVKGSFGNYKPPARVCTKEWKTNSALATILQTLEVEDA